MKLWRVTAEIEFVVASEERPTNGFNLDRLAEQEARDNGFDSCYVAGEITSEEVLPGTWDEDCVPRGDKSGKTIRQILLDNVPDESEI